MRSEHIRPRHQLGRRHSRTLRKSLQTGLVCSIVGVGLTAAVTAGITVAAYTDSGSLNTEFSSGDVFQIAAVGSDNGVRLVEGNLLTANLSSVENVVPGDTATISLDLANNSPSTAVGFALKVSSAGDLANDVKYSGTFTVQGGTTQLSFGTPDTPDTGVPAPAEAPRVLEIASLPQSNLAPRGTGTALLTEGEPWQGPDASRGVLKIFANIPESAGAGLTSATTTFTVEVVGISQ